METIEFLNDALVEIRAGKKGTTLYGYGAVFYQEGDQGTEFKAFDDHVERVQPGAFDDVVADEGHDVLALWNHDVNSILGRRSASTLKIGVDKRGLFYEVSLPNSPLGENIAESVRRRDVNGSSIGFIPGDGGVQYHREGNTVVRNIVKVGRLRDVGPVHEGAFSGTTVSARSVDAIRKDHERWVREEQRLARFSALTAKMEPST